MYNFVENLQKIEYYGIIVRTKKLILVWKSKIRTSMGIDNSLWGKFNKYFM